MGDTESNKPTIPDLRNGIPVSALMKEMMATLGEGVGNLKVRRMKDEVRTLTSYFILHPSHF
jgi:hypothetical protein